ncbi:hypothetical protein PMAYCL1PPCAC_30222 [Pristionchus mayeri]|uniref:Uncharacterized protein n=1 Tax=Pristionchus mayeri TaxID=1317129 RepID=A0AAN5D399_9BILA|nr:hypothetical protein PMAYCL1PPCAC_25781 [Pristionchus mayeri]GMR60027.1 hypothetical protein PMAYCL1PPCAC_30222 [Pristionchus mayeri]
MLDDSHLTRNHRTYLFLLHRRNRASTIAQSGRIHTHEILVKTHVGQSPPRPARETSKNESDIFVNRICIE